MKILYIDNLQMTDTTYEYGYRLEEAGVVLVSGFTSLPIVEGESAGDSLRKTCDQNIQIIVDGDSIGVGALNFGKGMSQNEMNERASTPEADEESEASV